MQHPRSIETHQDPLLPQYDHDVHMSPPAAEQSGMDSPVPLFLGAAAGSSATAPLAQFPNFLRRAASDTTGASSSTHADILPDSLPLTSSSSVRIGRPRHFHSGPTRTQPLMYFDVMTAIYEYLKERRDLARLARTSHAWLHAALHMPPLRWVYQCTKGEFSLHRLLASPLARRHLSDLMYWSEDGDFPILRLNALHLLADRLPHLRRLDCKIQLRPEMPPPKWPERLQSLTLRILIDQVTEQEAETLLALVAHSLVRHAPNITTLNIRCWGVDHSPYTIPASLMAPLRRLSISRLYLRGEATSEALRIARRMDQLKNLEVDSKQELIPILRWDAEVGGQTDEKVPPLQSISFLKGPILINDELAPLFLRLSSSLTRLQCWMALSDPTRFLPPFHATLTELDVTLTEVVHREAFVAAVKECHRLNRLSVEDDDLTSAQLGEFLPHLTSLTSLEIISAGVESLAFLSSTTDGDSLQDAIATSSPHTLLPLSSRLRQLHLNSCTALRPTELRHLRALKALEMLTIHRSLTQPLDQLSLATITPPSHLSNASSSACFARELWPKLRKFVYQPPEREGAGGMEE